MQFTLLLSIFCAVFTRLVQAAPTANTYEVGAVVAINSSSELGGIDGFTKLYAILATTAMIWTDTCTSPPYDVLGLPEAYMSFVASGAVLGDFSGLNSNTEATVFCHWMKGQDSIDITFILVPMVNATILEVAPGSA
ncbi:hypothetical protein K438DRAFT_1768931 [Mycena galopus ATCC 62051]|nr:hypothetical protein K438DRAFT_1784617 [Mycena galopus ATCC 62051]KAF8179571.1 hypothetical protein K438DRAFT_1768931 [Mycena galopus ATCC 62051]